MLSPNKSLILDFPHEHKKKEFTLVQLVVFVVFTIILSIAVTVFIFSNRNNWGVLKSIDSSNYENLKTSFSNLVDIKSKDAPTIIEVSNAANLKLQDTVLYTQVENNDLMLVYKDKVIIYRPSNNKIVNIFPVNN